MFQPVRDENGHLVCRACAATGLIEVEKRTCGKKVYAVIDPRERRVLSTRGSPHEPDESEKLFYA